MLSHVLVGDREREREVLYLLSRGEGSESRCIIHALFLTYLMNSDPCSCSCHGSTRELNSNCIECKVS